MKPLFAATAWLLLAVAPSLASISVTAKATGSSSPITIYGTASSSYAITGWDIYVDSNLVFRQNTSASSITEAVSMSTGTHKVVVKAWNTSGANGSASLAVTVGSSTAAVPVVNHVFVVVEENHSYSSVIGSSSMPYLNSLAQNYGLATSYYANTHPSIGNYLMLTAGQIITNNDSYTATVTADNIVRHLLTAGKTWKSYAESLPYAGYTGGDTGGYVERHNPLSYFSDVRNSSVEKMNLVPFTQFAHDLSNNALPRYSFIVPNVNHDAHNGTLAQADYWLKQNIGPLIASSTFQNGGLLVIVFDESFDSDTAYGGGHVAMVVVSPKAKRGYKCGTLFQHQSTLRLTEQALGVYSYPGAAGSASNMTCFF
jgi:phosphatidylinositol-3-phosphatase